MKFAKTKKNTKCLNGPKRKSKAYWVEGRRDWPETSLKHSYNPYITIQNLKIDLNQRRNSRIAYWSLIVVVLVEELVVILVGVVLEVVVLDVFFTRYHHTFYFNHIKGVTRAFPYQAGVR